MEPWEVMISESQERMVAIVAPERLAEVEAVIDRWELHHAVIGEVTDTGAPARALGRRGGRRDPGPVPHRRVPALRGRARAAASHPPRCRRRCPPPPRARCSSCSARRSSARARFVTRRYDQLVQSRTVRRPGLDAAVLRLRPDWRGLALTLDGQGRARLARPAPRRAARDPRGRAQRRLRRRRAARLHRLPQLRQPREARDRLGARRVDRGHGAGLRGARRADRLRQRLALQRHRRPLDPPDAGRRLRRPRARRPPRPARLAARATRSCSPARARRSRSPGSEAQARWGALGGTPDARPRLRGGARRATRRRGRAACLARPRRRRGRPRRRARRGGALERRRRRARRSTTTR